MAKKKVAYRKNRQNRLSMIMVAVVVLLVTIAVAVRSVELRQRLDVYTEKEASLQEQIDQEDRRAAEIEEFRKYTQTKQYAEEVAKEKLGLVYEGEILFKEEK